MSVDFLIRIFGMVVFAVIGGYWGLWFSRINAAQQIMTYTLGLGTVGALFGLVATCWFAFQLKTCWLG